MSENGAYDFAVLDFETTGLLDRKHNRVVEVAVLRFRPGVGVVDSFETIVNPKRDLGPTHIHGITGDDVEDAPLFEDIIGALGRILGGSVLVAHNASFDLAFLEDEFYRAGISLPPIASICTMRLPRRVGLASEGRSLAAYCSAYGIPYDDDAAHGAMHDAKAALGLFEYCFELAEQDGGASLAALGCVGRPPPAEEWYDDGVVPDLVVRGRASQSREREFGYLNALAARLRTTGTDDDVGFEEYFDLLDRVLEDHIVTQEEADSIVAWATAVGFSAERLGEANAAYLLAMVKAAWEDGVVTSAERAELLVAAHWLGLTEEELDRLIEAGELGQQRDCIVQRRMIWMARTCASPGGCSRLSTANSSLERTPLRLRRPLA